MKSGTPPTPDPSSPLDQKKDEFLPETVAAFENSIRQHLKYSLGKNGRDLSRNDFFTAMSLAVRDRLIERLLDSELRYEKADAKRVYYLSMEFLMGRSLGNNLSNLGLFHLGARALQKMGADLEEIRECENDAALGNGGLGRLAACYLESMATLGIPGFGYGINYEYGLFKQVIEDGYQKEKPDNWLEHGTPWEITRSDEALSIPIYGRVEHPADGNFPTAALWKDWKEIVGVPHDMPVVGYGGRSVNYLRLYSARSSQDFDMQIFNSGDYFKAMEQKITSETISKVLYPSDAFDAGRELRLVQEYFFVACALRDILRRFRRNHDRLEEFPSKVAIQMNDTHPALAVAEMMRLLVDESHVPWDAAWDITRHTFGYTNHTLLPEALERWPAALLERVVPRHLEFIHEINRRFLDHVATVWPGDDERRKRLSIIEDGDRPYVRMAHLAVVGSHSVNGVAALHSHLLKTSLLPDLHALWPERFHSVTNGVTQRRWLLKANPHLAFLISETIGDGWITDLDKLKALDLFADDAGFREAFLKIKQANKEKLTRVIKNTTGWEVDPTSLFDIQAKRMHEYKRQLLHLLHIIHEYLCLVEDGVALPTPRTHVLAGKAAPGYWAAKQTIKLIHNVAKAINNDPRVKDQLRVVFIPDYRVSLAEKIIPAADLSEHISTAGMEASGTGNMKFAMNGALTMGTLDGANIEILEEVGQENIYIFGLKAEEIQEMRQAGSYHPRDLYERHPHLKRIIDTFQSDRFCPNEPGLFRWIFQSILEGGDRYFHLADMNSYIEAQHRAAQDFLKKDVWARKVILNVARMGKFSSDRSVREYAETIWNVRAV
jgi:starch phosphorylase